MRSVLMAVVAGLMSGLAGEASSDDGRSAARLALEQGCVAVESIQALEYRSVWVSSEFSGDRQLPFELHEKGLVLQRNHEWWDSGRGLRRRELHELSALAPQSAPRYEDFLCGSDGEVYWIQSVSNPQRALSVTPLANNAEMFDGTVSKFLGYYWFGCGSHLTRHLLESSTFDPVATVEEDGTVRVSGKLVPPNGTYPLLIQIWMDPSRGHLPVRIATWFEWCNTRDYNMQLSRTCEVDGVFVPLEGSIESWSILEIYPDGLTIGDINAMSKQEWEKIAPRVKQVDKKSSSVLHLIVDQSSIVLNDLKPIEFYERPTVSAALPLNHAFPERGADNALNTRQPIVEPLGSSMSTAMRFFISGNVVFALLFTLRYLWQSRSRSGMRLPGIICIFVFAGVLAGCGRDENSLPLANSEIPSPEFPDGLYLDMGDRWEHAMLTPSFRVRNNSGQVIRFRKGVSSSCGCTSAVLTSNALDPGDELTIKLEIRTSTVPGEVREYSAVLHQILDNDQLRNHRLIVKAGTLAVWRMFPESIRVRRQTVNQTCSLSFTGIVGRQVQLTGLQATPPLHVVNSSSISLVPDRIHKVDIVIPGGTPSGRYEITAFATDASLSRKSVTLEVFEDKPLRVVPAVIRVRPELLSAGSKLATFVIIHPSAASLRLSGLEGCALRILSATEFEPQSTKTVADVILTSDLTVKASDKLVVEATNGGETLSQPISMVGVER